MTIPSVATIALEWAAFGGSLVSVWLYGRSAEKGPLAGMAVSLLFMAFGITTGVYAAAVSNIVFLFLHHRNFRKGRAMNWERIKKAVADGFRPLQAQAAATAFDKKWWEKYPTPEAKEEVTPRFLCLMHAEITESLEGIRTGAPDKNLPHRTKFEIGLADVVIRAADLADAHGIDLGARIAEKMEFNSTRPDHNPAHRELVGAKKF